MTDFFDRLFGLSALKFGGAGVEFGFARPIPPWGWMLAIAVAVWLAWWSYWRLGGGRVWRTAMASLRAVTLLALLLALSGPQLVRSNKRVERDWVVVLIDRSASMTIADAPGPDGTRRTREEQLASGLTASWPALSAMSADRTVLWLGFDAGAYDLKSGASLDVGEPDGRQTSLGRALEQALARAAARPLSGVVIISDGRSIDEPSRQTLRRLQAEKVPVLTVPLGSAEPIEDMAVEGATAPAMAFVNDTVPVWVDVERLGSAPGEPLGGKLQLVDKAAGTILDERPLPGGQWPTGRTRVTLTSKPAIPGRAAWVVRLVPDRPDLIEANNTAEVSVEFVDRPLRVAQFDGYPRWEYRYIKNLLLREKSIRSSSLLLASNRQYLQEGDVTLAAVPRSPEEWAQFDVVIIGDVQSGMFSGEQLEQIRDHVAVRGAGLLWIAGPGATPSSWRGTPLADLLPFTLASGDTDTVRAWDSPVLMHRLSAAERLGVLELGESAETPWPQTLTDPATGWSQLRWAQWIDPATVKPTAEVLASGIPARARASGPSESAPLVLAMRYGAGRVLYVATDEIWRWRYARGEALPERFWLPLIRMEGRESLARTARSASLEVSPRRAQVHQPVRIGVELLDQALVDAATRGEAGRRAVGIRLTRIGADRASGESPAELSLAPEASTGKPGAVQSFATAWLPDEPGKYRVDVTDPLLANLLLTAEVDVALPDDELRRPESDHRLLAQLSTDTGGHVIPIETLSEVPAMLPRRTVQISGTPDIETLWDRPPVLVLLVLLLALEWAGRRLLKLA